jgi:hypothetical protein
MYRFGAYKSRILPRLSASLGRCQADRRGGFMPLLLSRLNVHSLSYYDHFSPRVNMIYWQYYRGVLVIKGGVYGTV